MKLAATIKKDILILLRDRVGLLLMFLMPLFLVLIVTSIQSSTFDIVGKNRISVLICNKDTGRLSKDFVHALDTSGMFKLTYIGTTVTSQQITEEIRSKDYVAGVLIENGFSGQLQAAAKQTSGKALQSFGLEGDTTTASMPVGENTLNLYYNPVIQQSLKLSVKGVLNSAVQIIQSRETLKDLYFSINEAPMPDSLQNEMLRNNANIKEIQVGTGNEKIVLNASQHNVPAWTIFAMFFVVMSLGSNIVKEKSSGSFIRLKTLPTNYFVALLSKQITYLAVTFLQAFIIFFTGIYLFPLIGLPALQLPQDIIGLIIVTLISGWCAVSYALCVGVFAQTQEQANGFGAVSIVILSILGGLMIPSFIMPESFKPLMAISPLHWCLQAYYGLFLEGGTLRDVGINILSLIIITFTLQAIVLLELKRKKLI
ncbi:MAG: ABC transporter permease [Bacteroidetes bacterium]|nr:ABC transporter permease [Bacteroidota bacterium]